MRNIFPIIFILFSIGIFVGFVIPMYKEASLLKVDVASYNQALSRSTELEKTRDLLLKNYNEISVADKEQLSRFLPNTVDNIQLILEIQKIATSYNMSLKNIKFENPQTVSNTKQSQPSSGNQPMVVSTPSTIATLPYGIFNLEFSTQAPYAVFIEFLKDLERNLRLIDVQNVTFSVPASGETKITEGQDPNVYTYTLKIQTYWLKR